MPSASEQAAIDEAARRSVDDQMDGYLSKKKKTSTGGRMADHTTIQRKSRKKQQGLCRWRVHRGGTDAPGLRWLVAVCVCVLQRTCWRPKLPRPPRWAAGTSQPKACTRAAARRRPPPRRSGRQSFRPRRRRRSDAAFSDAAFSDAAFSDAAFSDAAFSDAQQPRAMVTCRQGAVTCSDL
jgi:hypothetical protein